MLELNALSFMTAATQISRMKAIVGAGTVPDGSPLYPGTIDAVKPMLEAFGAEANRVGAKLAFISADRLFRGIQEEPCQINWGQLGACLADIESRLLTTLIL